MATGAEGRGEKATAAVRSHLLEHGPTTWEGLCSAVDAPVVAVHRALQELMAAGEVVLVSQDPPCNPTYGLASSRDG